MALIVKIEKRDIAFPEYKEVEVKPVSFSSLENWNDTETLDEHIYRVSRLKTRMGKLVEVYTDEDSMKFLEEIMELTNEQLDIIIDQTRRRAFQHLSTALQAKEKEVREGIAREVKALGDKDYRGDEGYGFCKALDEVLSIINKK